LFFSQGTCVNNIVSYVCVCPAGWTGTACDIDINECLLPLICHPNATCINTIGSYRCICPAWLTDPNCYTPIDVCASLPCRNNGVCVYSYGGLSICRCQSGFTGVFCEVRFFEKRENVLSSIFRLISMIVNQHLVIIMEHVLIK
jgi:hypothetical protein